jgi:hypothetical protein
MDDQAVRFLLLSDVPEVFHARYIKSGAPYPWSGAKHGQFKGSPVRINLTMNSTTRKDLEEKRFADK